MTREQWAGLTPEKQRIKVAELCGWEYDGEYVVAAGRPEERVWIHSSSAWNGGWARIYELPRYLNDLNAMHEAEKVMTPEQAIDYVWAIGAVIDFENGVPFTATGNFQMMQATAAQRAEAFALTMDI